MNDTSPVQHEQESFYADLKHFVRKYGAALLVAGLAALLLGLVRKELPPFAIGLVLAILLEPLVKWAERRRISRGRAAAIIVFAPIVILGILVGLLTSYTVIQLTQLSGDIEKYRGDVVTLAHTVQDWWAGVVVKFGIPASVQHSITQLGHWFTSQLAKIGTFVQGFLSKIIWLFIVPITTYYLLAEGPRVRRKLLALMPSQTRDHIRDIGNRIGGVFSGYVRGVVATSLLYGIAQVAVFLILGLPYAAIVGCVATVFYILPYVGPSLTFLTAFVLAVIGREQSWVPGYAPVIIASSMVLIWNMIFDYTVTPRIVGGQVKLHPLISIFAMITGYSLMGLGGMILAIPLAASIQVVVVALLPSLDDEARVERSFRTRRPRDRAVVVESAAPVSPAAEGEERTRRRSRRPRRRRPEGEGGRPQNRPPRQNPPRDDTPPS